MRNALLFSKLRKAAPSHHALDMIEEEDCTVSRSPFCACQVARGAMVHTLGRCPETHCNYSRNECDQLSSVHTPCVHRAVSEITFLPIQTFSFPELQQLNCRVSMLDTVGFLLKYQCVEGRKCRVSIEPTSNPGIEYFYYCGRQHCCWNENVLEVPWTIFRP